MRSLLFSIAIIFCITINAMAQMPPNTLEDDTPQKEKSFGERLVFGGSLGAQLGDQTFVNVSPIVGYRVTDKLTSGIGITYIYYRYKYYTGYGNQTVTEKDNIYGGDLWSEYRIIPQAFLHAEYGLLNLSVPKITKGYYYGETARRNVYDFLVGGGYYQEIGPNAGVQFSILWDLIEDQYSPYQNPIIRIGFTAGF